jgi:radical SAM superfamily enzyme YgiQ (UPF0313 family)
MPIKFALIHLGNEEQYGLLFAASEFRKYGEVKFFDAEFNTNLVADIIAYDPNYACFSVLTVFSKQAQSIADKIKSSKTKVIFGGHHVLYNDCDVDYIIKGTAHGVFPKLLKEKVIINPPLNPNNYPLPARDLYYRDIPRLKTRYRKVMASMFGCPFNCSYCASNCGNLIKMWGVDTYKQAYLTRRDIPTLIQEAEYIKDTTQEIECVDDDFFYGDPKWIEEFIVAWKEKINLPLYISTTSKSILNTKSLLLAQLRSIVNCVGVGVQATDPTSLKMFNRQWDNINQMKEATYKLKQAGFKVNLQAIVGLPITDPVEDAINTLEGLKEIGEGEVVSVYPLQIYNGTELYRYCIDNGIELNPNCNGDTNSGIPAVKFDTLTERRIRNICKLATMIVKYGIDKEWYLPLLDIEYDQDISKQLSMIRYKNCIRDRLGNKGIAIFNDIVKNMNIRS